MSAISVCKVTYYGQEEGGSIPSKDRLFFHHLCVQIGSGTHLASHRWLFPRGKATEAWSRPSTSI